jgi:hypothetical protein
LAAVLSDRVRSDATIVCVVSGRNIAVSVLNEVLADS